MNGLIAGSIYALIAIGFNLIYSTKKFFDLAHGSMLVIGGYTVYYFSISLAYPVWLSVILGIVAAGLSGLLLDVSLYRALRKKKATGMVLLVASLGAFTALQAATAMIFTSQFQRLSPTSTFESIEIFGAHITTIQIAAIGISLTVWFLMVLLLKYTRFGKVIKAVSDDEGIAKIIGINTEKVFLAVSFLGAAIAGIGGILYGFDTGIEPVMGLPLLLKGIIAAIIGGIGSIHGALVGAYFLALVENFGIWKISSEWKDAISFGVLIIFLLFRPNGIFKR